MVGATATPSYFDNAGQYNRRLEETRRQLNKFDASSIMPMTTPVTPYGLSIVAGLPLFRTHYSQREFGRMKHELETFFPRQYYYDNGKTHISFAVPIRNNPMHNGFNFKPAENKVEFYGPYLAMFRSISFKPFSLRAEGIFPQGILLWRPEENADEVFNIRRQLFDRMLEQKTQHPDFYFDTRNGGPDVGTGIVHSTFMRFYDVYNLQLHIGDYRRTLERLNEQIAERKLFQNPILVDEIAFVETRVSDPITLGDYYTDVVLERRKS